MQGVPKIGLGWAEKRDLIEQLKLVAKEIIGKIAHRIEETTLLLETTIESWLGIEHIDVVEEVHEEIR